VITAIRCLLVVLFMMVPGLVQAEAYPNAHSLYEDCSDGLAGLRDEADKASALQLRKCRNFLKAVVKQWTRDIDLDDEGIFPCYRYQGDLIEYSGDPHKYVEYWDAHGLGFTEGFKMSAGSSVYEFLNSDMITTCVRTQ
jgi:hypothetical protein